MEFEQEILLDSGVTATHWVVNEVRIRPSEKSVQIVASIYLSKEAKDSGKTSIAELVLSQPSDDIAEFYIKTSAWVAARASDKAKAQKLK